MRFGRWSRSTATPADSALARYAAAMLARYRARLPAGLGASRLGAMPTLATEELRGG
jgi:hypothetical protein